MNVPEQLNLGLAHHRAGRLAEAEKIYREIVGQHPEYAEPAHFMGVLLGQTGRLEQAEAYFRRAISIKPDFAEAHNNLGNALKAKGRLDEAITSYHDAIRFKPDLAEAHNNLGNALRDLGRFEEAIASFGRAVRLNPQYAEAHCNLGNALKDNGQMEEAIASYRQAIRIKPDLAEAYSNIGNVVALQGRLDEAVALHRKAIEIKPDLAQAHYNLGNALADLGRRGEAITSFRQAIVLRPDYAEAYCNLGNTLKKVGQLDEAIAAIRHAIEIKPNFADAHLNLGGALKDTGQIEKGIEAIREAIRIRPDHAGGHSNLVLSLLYDPGYDSGMVREELGRWNKRHAEPLRKFIRPHSNGRDPDRRLRIGYVSPDFADHVVGRNLLPLFREHDHQQLEIFCYAGVVHGDEFTEQFRRLADVWRGAVGLSDSRLADLIREDKIDILVDLSLHTGNNRLPVFARKPAPVQVTFAGYPGSTGLETIDYRLTDPYLDPPGGDESVYSEKSVRLPDSFWCFDPRSIKAPINALPAQPAGLVTFGCLCNFVKVSRHALRLWSRVLKAVEGSRLLLLCPEGAHRRWVLEQMQGEGIATDRVEFAPRCAYRKYLELYNRIDIALDTIPYNGHTTSLDSFWMGVPVVTLEGKTVVGRAGVSQLTNLGLTELIARTPEEYVEIAAKLANDLPRLRELRQTLRGRMRASPLMDAPRFARNIENAYREMWRKWCEGK